MRSLRTIVPALIAVASANAAQPQTALLAPDLQERCRAYITEPGSMEGALCLTYVQGFLDGAVSIDARVRPDTQTAPESWMERAQRTRLGPERLGTPAYCVDKDEPVHRIIDRLVTYGEERPPGPSLHARDYIALALRRLYPC